MDGVLAVVGLERHVEIVDRLLMAGAGIEQRLPGELTVLMVASALGLPVWKLGRDAAQGLFPTYSLLNTRRLVKLSEVAAAIEASRQGGGA